MSSLLLLSEVSKPFPCKAEKGCGCRMFIEGHLSRTNTTVCSRASGERQRVLLDQSCHSAREPPLVGQH